VIVPPLVFHDACRFDIYFLTTPLPQLAKKPFRMTNTNLRVASSDSFGRQGVHDTTSRLDFRVEWVPLEVKPVKTFLLLLLMSNKFSID
jgi:hypothetical protein